ncbi:glycosyltransferase [Methanoregula sp.]|uniref:glycosyltransferase n=1 Tax=Methanoregula sp. TaxID=2052170 RepID=UPI002374D52F|nr:glycosyltransferase [Methanoregula sp.]MDD1687196.1 glycosyltransferase [Methanoregula sp.]
MSNMHTFQRTFINHSKKILRQVHSMVFRPNDRIIWNFDEYLPPCNLTGSGAAPKKALVSYIVKPLLPCQGRRDTSTFSNNGIAQYIPRALNELGYSVDIVNYDNRKFIPTKKYDLFIGHTGINFENITEKLDSQCTKIYFSTGTYWKSWNLAEQSRRDDLQSRRGAQLPVDRFIGIDEEYANTAADGIICLGNDVAKETYSKFPSVVNINNAVFPDKYSIANKNFNAGRNNFLFFNGWGNVHKGLDLLLDAFTQLDQHLYVRQDIEPAFLKIYKKELTEYPNIHLVPFLEKPSKDFFSLMDTCNFIISPTCAEGQPGSVIECMAHGLIPLLSREANIDTKEFGLTFKENRAEEIISVVREVSQKPEAWYKDKSSQTLEEIRNYYTPEQFLKNMKSAVQTIVQNKSQTLTKTQNIT